MEKAFFVVLCLFLQYGSAVNVDSHIGITQDIQQHLPFSSEFISKWLPSKKTKEEVKAIQNEVLSGMKERDPNQQTDIIPVVIIPSFIGNTLWAQLNDSSPPAWYCDSNTDWFYIFYNEEELYPYIIDCWIYNMELVYNSGISTPPQGVNIKAPNYGSTYNCCAYIDQPHDMPLWETIIGPMLNNFSYVDGVSLRAAPYDWRYGPDYLDEHYNNLRNLIEETYTINGNKSVALTTLSMGGPLVINFLNNYVNQEWKDTYIHSLTTFSGVWGGSTWAIIESIMVSPTYTKEAGVATSRKIGNTLRSWGATTWLLPNENVFADQVFVTSEERNYTSSPSDLIDLIEFVSINSTTNPPDLMAKLYSKVMNFLNYSAPGVPMNCIYGTNLSTPALVVVKNESDWMNPANYTVANGDGTILEASASFCTNWEQDQPLVPYVFENMRHAEAIHDPRAISVFYKTLGLL